MQYSTVEVLDTISGQRSESCRVVCYPLANPLQYVYGNITLASARVTALAEGSLEDPAMVISIRKSKAMHVHRARRVDASTEEDIAAHIQRTAYSVTVK